jgi:hypothetical protein
MPFRSLVPATLLAGSEGNTAASFGVSARGGHGPAPCDVPSEAPKPGPEEFETAPQGSGRPSPTAIRRWKRGRFRALPSGHQRPAEVTGTEPVGRLGRHLPGGTREEPNEDSAHLRRRPSSVSSGRPRRVPGARGDQESRDEIEARLGRRSGLSVRRRRRLRGVGMQLPATGSFDPDPGDHPSAEAEPLALREVHLGRRGSAGRGRLSTRGSSWEAGASRGSCSRGR